MSRLFRPRAIIQFGLFVAFVGVVSVALLNNGQNFAALAYPPIPEGEIDTIFAAVKHCGFPDENAEQMASIVAGTAFVESRFRQDNNIVSSAGAVGRMQLLRPTLAGMGVKYQIPGINAQTAGDVKISYYGGTCYLHYIMNYLTGDGADPAHWADERKRKAVYIGYNAGPARGRSYLGGNYNGPRSSVGYAEKVDAAARVYRYQVTQYRQKVKLSPADELSNQLRNLIWTAIIPPDDNE